MLLGGFQKASLETTGCNQALCFSRSDRIGSRQDLDIWLHVFRKMCQNLFLGHQKRCDSLVPGVFHYDTPPPRQYLKTLQINLISLPTHFLLSGTSILCSLNDVIFDPISHVPGCLQRSDSCDFYARGVSVALRNDADGNNRQQQMCVGCLIWSKHTGFYLFLQSSITQ